MAKHFLMLAKATALSALTAMPLSADQQAIAHGSILSPTQIGHIFDTACIATVPSLMERRAAIVVDAFGFEEIDLGTDAGWISPNGAITITVDGNAIEATCALSVTADLAGDGGELYESLEAHLSDHLDGNLPEGSAIDGGLAWAWDGSNASFTLNFYQVEGAYLIALTSEG